MSLVLVTPTRYERPGLSSKYEEDEKEDEKLENES